MARTYRKPGPKVGGAWQIEGAFLFYTGPLQNYYTVTSLECAESICRAYWRTGMYRHLRIVDPTGAVALEWAQRRRYAIGQIQGTRYWRLYTWSDQDASGLHTAPKLALVDLRRSVALLRKHGYKRDRNVPLVSLQG